MRRELFLTGVAALALLVAAAGANANHSNGEGPKNDFVVGTGQNNFGEFHVFAHVNAVSGPSGEDPRGDIVFTTGPPAFPIPVDFKGRVTCLLVVGNAATVGIEITKSKEPGIAVGSGAYFSFVDKGEPGTADEFEAFPVSSPPHACIPAFTERPITSGNYVVHDARP